MERWSSSQVPKEPYRVAIGLGANLGDRQATLAEAVKRLHEFVDVTATSPTYETAPIDGPPGQPPFLNAVILADCTLSPDALLGELLRVEAELGRTRRVTDIRFGPRAIDLDVLWIPNVVIDAPTLRVPHPRLHERAFALAPLLDLVPDAADPITGARYVVPPGEIMRLANS